MTNKDAPACDRADELMSLLYEEATQAEQQSFKQHLATCASCTDELAAFRQIRTPLLAWRDESLGVKKFPVTPQVTQTRSAIAAIRQFLSLSPVWLKGAVAAASVLFCLLAALALSRMNETPPAEVANNQNYSEEQIQALVEKRAQQMVQEQKAQQQREGVARTNVEQPPKKSFPNSTNKALRVAAAKGTRRPLSKTEREQLAADLRLSDDEDTDLDLLGDRLSRQDD